MLHIGELHACAGMPHCDVTSDWLGLYIHMRDAAVTRRGLCTRGFVATVLACPNAACQAGVAST